MLTISPRLGEFLVKTTRSRDIDDALRRVFSEYLVMKTTELASISESFKKRWGMDFDEFKPRLEKGTLEADSYGFDTEQDFWEWEEVETLRKHYDGLQEQWM